MKPLTLLRIFVVLSGKALKVFAIILIVAAYCNIGYYGSRSYVDASQKFYKNQPLNSFQEFQLSYGGFLREREGMLSVRNSLIATKIVSYIFWPIGLMFSLFGWAACGVVVIIKLIFSGGMARLICH